MPSLTCKYKNGRALQSLCVVRPEAQNGNLAYPPYEPLEIKAAQGMTQIGSVLLTAMLFFCLQQLSCTALPPRVTN